MGGEERCARRVLPLDRGVRRHRVAALRRRRAAHGRALAECTGMDRRRVVARPRLGEPGGRVVVRRLRRQGDGGAGGGRGWAPEPGGDGRVVQRLQRHHEQRALGDAAVHGGEPRGGDGHLRLRDRLQRSVQEVWHRRRRLGGVALLHRRLRRCLRRTGRVGSRRRRPPAGAAADGAGGGRHRRSDRPRQDADVRLRLPVLRPTHARRAQLLRHHRDGVQLAARHYPSVQLSLPFRLAPRPRRGRRRV